MERSKFVEFLAAGKEAPSAPPVLVATANVPLPHPEPFAAPRLEPPRRAKAREFFDGFPRNVSFMRPEIPSIVPTPDLQPNARSDREYKIHFGIGDLEQAAGATFVPRDSIHADEDRVYAAPVEDSREIRSNTGGIIGPKYRMVFPWLSPEFSLALLQKVASS